MQCPGLSMILINSPLRTSSMDGHSRLKRRPYFLKMVFRVTQARIPFRKRFSCQNSDVQNIWISSQFLTVTSLIVLAWVHVINACICEELFRTGGVQHAASQSLVALLSPGFGLIDNLPNATVVYLSSARCHWIKSWIF